MILFFIQPRREGPWCWCRPPGTRAWHSPCPRRRHQSACRNYPDQVQPGGPHCPPGMNLSLAAQHRSCCRISYSARIWPGTALCSVSSLSPPGESQPGDLRSSVSPSQSPGRPRSRSPGRGPAGRLAGQLNRKVVTINIMIVLISSRISPGNGSITKTQDQEQE